jgi:transposase
MTAPSLARGGPGRQRLLPPQAQVKVGIEAAGHYHRPLLAPGSWPAGWELLELNPGHVTEQRRVLGKRTIKTDAVDLQAMTELLLAGRGLPVRGQDTVLTELTAWSAHRTSRVALRTATKNQLLGQLDRSFPGLTLALPDVLRTKVGRLVAAEFADPARLAALGSSRFIRFGANRGLQIRRLTADKLVAVARTRCRCRRRGRSRRLAADLTLLADLDRQIEAAAEQLVRLVPLSPFGPLLSVKGWGAVRAGNYGGALGDPTRFTNSKQVYRTAGLNPIQYESGRQAPRQRHQPRRQRRAARALIDLGIGLWLNDPAAKQHAADLRAAARRAASSPAPWRTARTASRSPSSATTPPTTRPAGPTRRTDPGPSQLRPAVPPSRARRTRTRRRPGYGRPATVMPLLAWRPGPSPCGSPNEARRPALA